MTTPASGAPPLLRLYRGATRLIAPLAYRHVARKLRSAGTPAERIPERFGQATIPRPQGRLVWFHAASVGESLSVLTLIARLAERHASAQFLITSGTATSAQIIARRLPPRTHHQFAPLDAPRAVTAFYDHWRPDAGIFVESEIWPNLLEEARARGVPLALLNARFSDKSVQTWRKWPATAAYILGAFDILIAQNLQNANNLAKLGAPPKRLRTGTNLKSMSAPLPVDPGTLADLNQWLDYRPVWTASSTHDGEEDAVLAAHSALLSMHPDLCLILIPRHPERGDKVAAMIADRGLSFARRSAGETLTSAHQVYLADTLGETGTWYAASPIVFVAGSLLPIGGHNPFEPAQAGAAILTGPHRANFAETYNALLSSGAALEIADAAGLARAVGAWLSNPADLEEARTQARRFVQTKDEALLQLVETLEGALGLGPADG